MIHWKLFTKAEKWPEILQNTFFDKPPERVEGRQLRVCFVGHSTFLIQTEGLNILTDPIWSQRASPFINFGPKRYSEPGIHLKDLPPIDLILISHNHYDHLDMPTIQKVHARDKSAIITPLGNDVLINSYNPHIDVQTLDWYQSIDFNKSTTIHLMPSQHWSGRKLIDRNKALWGAFVITTPAGNILFAGDTGYGDGYIFRELRKKFISFKLALLPIGTYEPRWFMKYSHMSPDEAVAACIDLGEPNALGMHIKTFQLGDEDYDDPSNRLKLALSAKMINAEKFRILDFGEALYY